MTISFPQYKNCLFLLYPSFLSTTDKCCTISNGALMKFSGFKRVLIDTNQQLDLTLQDNRTLSLPFITENCIDYIKIHISYFIKGDKQRTKCKTTTTLIQTYVTSTSFDHQQEHRWYSTLLILATFTVQPQINSNTPANDRQRLHYRTWTTMQTSTAPRKMSHM